MTELLAPGASGLGQAAVLALLLTIGVLFLGTVVLSLYAVAMRARHLSEERESHELTERWREPVLSAVEDPARVPSVQALVDEDDAVHFLGFVIEYARRVRGDERRVLRELAKPFLPPMAEKARTAETEIRAWAVQTLGTLGLPEFEKEVVAALDDPSPLVAMVAARALAAKDTPQYAGAVLDRLERFQGWNRLFLASMLAAMGPDVSETLRARLADPEVPEWSRAVMAEALRLQGDFLAGDVAAQVVSDGRGRELLASALRLLAAVGRPEHADVVRPLCATEDVVVRAQALRAMGHLAGRDDVPALVEAMNDPSPWPALYAARGVRDAGGRDALEDLARTDRPIAELADQVLHEEGDR